MKFTSFIFICGWYLVLTLFSSSEFISLDSQLIVAGIFIFSVGIPHGAIDHIIFFEENRAVSTFQFYFFYFSLMAGYVLAWLVLPLWSFIFFLLVSAFHFGQSQFSDIQSVSKMSLWVSNLTWGLSVLSSLIYYRANELSILFSQYSDLEILQIALNENFHSILLAVSSLLFFMALCYWLWEKAISAQRFFMEIFLLGLIHLSFFTLPVIIGFTLYFSTLHSARVLVEEFNYLKKRKRVFSFQKFVWMLLPYSFLSIIGGGLLLLLSYWDWISVSSILLGLILISIITLPHSIVMDGFYGKMNKS